MIIKWKIAIPVWRAEKSTPTDQSVKLQWQEKSI